MKLFNETEHPSYKKLTFCELVPGDVFEDMQGTIGMKTNNFSMDGKTVNAIRLDNGDMDTLQPTTMVYLLDVEIHYKRILCYEENKDLGQEREDKE